MKKYDILSLPKIRFAHTHEAESYDVYFPPRSELIEITYIAEGQLFLEKNGCSFIAEKGDILCNIFDSGVFVKTNNFHCHHTISAKLSLQESDNSNALYLPTITKASADTEDIKEMIDFCIYKPYRYENSSAKESKAVLDILCKIDEVSRKRESFPEKDISIWAEKAKKYIHKNIHKPLTQREVSEYLGISTGYLCNVFKKAENITVIKYINTIKLKRIYALMQKENIKLYEAAELYGYNDPNYVSALYKKTFGHNITSKT